MLIDQSPIAETARRIAFLAVGLRAFLRGDIDTPPCPPSVLVPPLLPLIREAIALLDQRDGERR